MSSVTVKALHREFFYNGTRIPDPAPSVNPSASNRIARRRRSARRLDRRRRGRRLQIGRRLTRRSAASGNRNRQKKRASTSKDSIAARPENQIQCWHDGSAANLHRCLRCLKHILDRKFKNAAANGLLDVDKISTFQTRKQTSRERCVTDVSHAVHSCS